MLQSFLSVGAVSVLLICGWFYWQIKNAEARVLRAEAEIEERSRLVGRAIDEVLISIHQMYREMDRCLIRLDQTEVGDVIEEISEAIEAIPEAFSAQEIELEKLLFSPDEPANAVSKDTVSSNVSSSFDDANETNPETWSPYTEAIRMAAKGMDYVEIARHIDMGIEELRLLLQFRGQRFTAS